MSSDLARRCRAFYPGNTGQLASFQGPVVNRYQNPKYYRTALSLRHNSATIIFSISNIWGTSCPHL